MVRRMISGIATIIKGKSAHRGTILSKLHTLLKERLKRFNFPDLRFKDFISGILPRKAASFLGNNLRVHFYVNFVVEPLQYSVS